MNAPLPTVFEADFGTCACLLQDDPTWGTEILRRAGAPALLLHLARLQTRRYPSRIEAGGVAYFYARGTAGMRWPLRYRVERAGEGRVAVTPASSLCLRDGLRSAVFLALLGGWPVIFLPLIQLRQRAAQRRAGQRYLPALRAYLEENAPPRASAISGSSMQR